jgi:hypothetical protein
MEWIRCDDEMPEHYKNVLFWADGEVVYGNFGHRSWSSELIDDLDSKGCDYWRGSYHADEVTHWMPLPDPPEVTP